MRTIKIYCKECKSEITSELTEISESMLFWDENNQNIIQKGKFSFLENPKSNNKRIIVALDVYNLKNHSDINRFAGCCGSDGGNGLNKLCLNGHEVATEVSDCWTAHYVEFDCNKIIIEEKIDNDTYKELRI